MTTFGQPNFPHLGKYTRSRTQDPARNRWYRMDRMRREARRDAANEPEHVKQARRLQEIKAFLMDSGRFAEDEVRRLGWREIDPDLL